MKKSNIGSARPRLTKLTLDGKDYKFGYNLNAFAEIEETHGSIAELITRMEQGSIKAVRSMIWAGLLCNGEEAPSEWEVGEMLHLSDMSELVKSIQESLTNALPEADEKN